jgi:hypothetical protein
MADSTPGGHGNPRAELLARSARVIAAGTLFHTIKPTSFGLLAMGVDAGDRYALHLDIDQRAGLEPARLLHNSAGDSISVYEAHVHEGDHLPPRRGQSSALAGHTRVR